MPIKVVEICKILYVCKTVNLFRLAGNFYGPRRATKQTTAIRRYLVTLRSILLLVSKQLIVTGRVAELDEVANAVISA